MRDLLITLFVFGSIPYILMRPYIGLLIWSWLGYMNPHRLTWGFAYDFPFVQVVAIVTLVSLVLSKEPKRFPVTPLVVVWLLFSVWVVATHPWALNPEFAGRDFYRFIKIQVMIVATLLLINTRERVDYLIWVIVISLGFFGVKGGLFTALTGGNYIVWGPAESFIEGNNEMAFALVVTVPLMYYLSVYTTNKWIRWALYGSMGLLVLSILGSYSRGAFLAVSAMLVMLWLRSRKKVLIGVAFAVVASSGVAFMPQKWIDRMYTIETYEQDGSAMGRINAWRMGWNLVKDHPIVGGGFDSFRRAQFAKYAPNPEDIHDAHSIYFEVLTEHGFVGFGLYIMIGVLMMLTCRATVRDARDRPDLKWAADLSKMLQVCLIGYCVGGAFLGLAYFDLSYHLMSISVVVRVIVRDAVAAEHRRVRLKKPRPALS